MKNPEQKKRMIGIVLFGTAILLAFFVTGSAMYNSPDVGESFVDQETANALLQAQTISEQSEVTSEVSDSLPSRLIIPKLGINADVQHLGVTSSGLMAAPSNFTDVSWYKLGAIPGSTGSAVMAGHEDNAISLDGVFKRLGELENGDLVHVEQEDGSRLTFKVVKKEVHPYNLKGKALEEIFTSSTGKYLNLITCTGDWLPEAKTNDKRIIVFTELVE